MRARLALAAALLAASCSGGADTGESASPTTPTTASVASTTTTAAQASSSTAGEIRVRLARVAEFRNPVNMTASGGVLYVVEQAGRVRAVRDGRVDARVVLDIADQVKSGGEQGLLGLAFSNDRSKLYVNYTDTQGDTRVVEYAFDGVRAVESTRRELLKIDQPFPNHNGGHIVVDRDDILWIGMGDGGSAGDPQDNAQNASSLLGKMLHLDPGDANPQPRIWASGLRNPWRFHLDYEAGALWVADVGQNAIEEINRVPLDRAGINYGWARREGSRPFRGGEKPPGAVDPLFEYAHEGGVCSVTGGGVYRGRALPGLVGAYLFGDYCVGDVKALFPERDGGTRVLDLDVSVQQLTSFGTDEDGEMYVLSAGDGGMYRLVPE
ncbi:MAG: PQQ-dependent sugar dehydrogenase [Acidimicrobiia bacterium]